MNSYQNILTSSPAKRALFYLFACLVSFFLISVGNGPTVVLLLLLACIFIFRLLYNTLRIKDYKQTIAVALENHLEPTWGYGKKGFLLVDPGKRLLVCNGKLIPFDNIQSVKAQSQTTFITPACTIMFSEQNGRTTVFGVRSQNEQESVMDRLSADTGFQPS
ncbi:hypothetical protein [Desulfovibrio sp.]|uniref:hypothetical protein n=1 Tax=Desulfovibrio sp. TaxID=885 RepID=UPI0025BD1F8F|nr:hypothetical protein [Desulfovibrio sp.]